MAASCSIPTPTSIPTFTTPAATFTLFQPITTSSPTAVTPTPTLGTILFEKGPYLVAGNDPSQMTILWQDVSGLGTLEWGLDTSYSSGKVTGQLISEDGLQQALLTFLPPAARIHYRAVRGGAAASGSFLTPPIRDSASTVILWVYGDSRSGPEIQNAIAARILEDIWQHPEDQTLVLFTGDLMDTADESSLQVNLFDPQWTDLHQLLSQVPLITARGNHDGTQIMNKYFPYPFAGEYYWSLDYGSAHIAVVDQYSDLSEFSPQLKWLKDDLDASLQPWKIILLHRPGWSAGPHEDDLVVQKLVHPLAYHAGVQVVLAGHNHYYARARVDGIQYITTGGGGAPLYDPVCSYPNMLICKKDYHYLKMVFSTSTLTVTAFSPQGEVLDEFSITR